MDYRIRYINNNSNNIFPFVEEVDNNLFFVRGDNFSSVVTRTYIIELYESTKRRISYGE